MLNIFKAKSNHYLSITYTPLTSLFTVARVDTATHF